MTVYLPLGNGFLLIEGNQSPVTRKALAMRVDAYPRFEAQTSAAPRLTATVRHSPRLACAVCANY